MLAYVERCKRLVAPPCGRWMVHLYHRRFYMDAASGSLLTEQHIYSQKLGGFSRAFIQDFYDKVNYAREALPASEHPSEHKLGHWLFLQIKTCRQFDHEIRRYKKSKATSKYRTFSYLWRKIRTWLLEQRYDANAKDIDVAFNKGPLLADGEPLSRVTGGGKETKAQKRARAAAAKAQQAEAKDAEAAAQGGDAAAGKGKGKGDGGKDQPLTMEAKAQMPCVRFFGQGGTCKYGERCFYSHTNAPPPTKPKGANKASGPPPKGGKAPGGVALATGLVAASSVGVDATPQSRQPGAATNQSFAMPAVESATTNDWQKRTLLATRGWFPRVLTTLAALTAPLQNLVPALPGQLKVEWVDDTGAGRHLGSIKHYQNTFGLDAGEAHKYAHSPYRKVVFLRRF
jgi:hypothetical protein